MLYCLENENFTVYTERDCTDCTVYKVNVLSKFEEVYN